MKYELHPERHPSVERDMWVHTLIIKYNSNENKEDSFEVFGAGISVICSWFCLAAQFKDYGENLVIPPAMILIMLKILVQKVMINLLLMVL